MWTRDGVILAEPLSPDTIHSSAAEAARVPTAMLGSATLTIVVSRTAMNEPTRTSARLVLRLLLLALALLWPRC